ncbi:MAG: winged helix-turn-helix transcriptional regulator [Elusimicrobia bacterium]|nr:winged helix-turn-helix transcriptional regulator [Elusimicrobiota bacterium]
MLSQIKHPAALHNPQFYKNESRRFSNHQTPRFIKCFREDFSHIHLPRGTIEDVQALAREAGSDLISVDRRIVPEKISLQFRGTLSPEQDVAMKSVLAHDMGMLVAPPGAGKTVMGCFAAAQRGVPTLVLGDRKPLLEQWRKQIMALLGLVSRQIGQVGGGRDRQSGVVDLATIQSLARRDDLPVFANAWQMRRFIPQAQMSLIAFKGTERVHIFDRRDVRDDLLTQFKEAINFIEKHLNVRSEIKGLDREDIYEIPLAALREAVVNALMHRDYSITGTQVSVDIFDDRVEITNPGGLPNGLPRKSFGTVSVRRNELIADLFSRLHKVERAGTGIQRMKEVLAAAGLKAPEFETDGFFRTIFFRSPEFAKATARQNGGSQKSSQKIVEFIAQSPEITIDELAAKLRISSRAVKKHLSNLKKGGRIQRIGPDKGGHWKISGHA